MSKLKNEVKKMAKSIVVVILVVALVAGLVGAGTAWVYRDSEVSNAFNAGVTYQQEITPSRVLAASISLSMANATFVHTSTVGSGGAVTAETAVTDYLDIENTDETRTATNTKVTLLNPITGTEGLHDDLQTDYTEVYLTIGGVRKSLYHDGKFTSGVTIGTLDPGDLANVTITFTLEVAVAGTFQDAQTHSNTLWLYQPSASDTDSITFTVTT